MKRRNNFPPERARNRGNSYAHVRFEITMILLATKSIVQSLAFTSFARFKDPRDVKSNTDYRTLRRWALRDERNVNRGDPREPLGHKATSRQNRAGGVRESVLNGNAKPDRTDALA